MKKQLHQLVKNTSLTLALGFACAMGSSAQDAQNKNLPAPFLRKQGTTTQLVVEGKPLLMLGGELANSSTSNLDYMKNIWPKLSSMHLNTVLAPVYWELMEPEEGKFDFTLIDGVIQGARANKMKIVFLWFGVWKNSMSCYAPLWVKKDQQRFPRAQAKNNKSVEILSAFSKDVLDADIKAYRALMKHIKEFDAKQQTVVMVQVENEIGMLPEARDHSALAGEYFKKQVPAELISYMQSKKDKLSPWLLNVWVSNGTKTTGTWEEVFGKGDTSDEIFMAYYYGKFIDQLSAAGKNEYALPMYVNAALNRPYVRPGDYPSAGPLPHLVDVWNCAAPHLDFLSPDIYYPDYTNWIEKYDRNGNAMFVPETYNGPTAGAKAFYTFGRHEAMGYSPFSIESTDDAANEPVAKSYEILAQLSPLILESQGKGSMTGALLDHNAKVRKVVLGDYELTVSHDYTLGWSPKAKDGEWPAAGCTIIKTGPDEYLVAGTGVVITFDTETPGDPIVGIGSIDEGKFVNGKWIAGRRLNGDEDHQGRHLRIPVGTWDIQKVKLYRYK